jgi:arylsulfatase
VRYKNWKMYYTMTKSGAVGWLEPLTTFHFTLVQNIKRDPFEQCVLPTDGKTAMGLGGALGAPSTAYIYDWNILPIGQLLWEKELMSYKEFPPLQAPETYNLSGILREMQKSRHASDSRHEASVTWRAGRSARAAPP